MKLGKVGFIFSGGGYLASHSVGYLKALYELGIKPDFVQGVSAGALNLAILASHGWKYDELEKTWLKLQLLGKSAVFNGKEALVNASLNHSAIYNNKRLMDIILADLKPGEMIDSKIAWQIIATNDNKECQEIFSNRGKLIKSNPDLIKQSLLASSALPGFLPSIKIGDNWYSDGMTFILGEAVKAKCDTIFILFNNRLTPNAIDFGKLAFYYRILYNWHITVNLLAIREMKYAKSRGYEIIESSPSGLFDEDDSFYANVRRRIKSITDGVVGAASAKTDAEDILVPHRIILLTPPHPIPTLQTLDFRMPDAKTGYPGDINLAIKNSYENILKFLKDLGL